MAFVTNSKKFFQARGGQEGYVEEYGSVTLVTGTAALDTTLRTIKFFSYGLVGTSSDTGVLRLDKAANTDGTETVSGGSINVASSSTTSTATYQILLRGLP